MAYLPSFSGINSALNPDEEEKNKLTRQGESGGGDVAAAQGAPGGVAAPSYTQSNFAGGKRILDKAQGAKLGVDLTSDVDKQTDAANTGLANAKTKFGESVNSEIGKNTLAQDQIDKGIAGDQPAFSAIGAALKAKPIDAKADAVSGPDAGGLKNLSTQSGLQYQLQNKLGGQKRYTRGMAGLDSNIYQKDADFQNKVAASNQRMSDTNKNLADFYSGTGAGSQSDILAQGNAKLAQNQTGILDALRAKQAGILDPDAAAQRGLAANQKLEMSRDKSLSPNRTKINDIVQSILGDSDLSSKEIQAIKDNIHKKQNTVIKSNLGSDRLYSQGQADQFNRINQLLGKTDQLDMGEQGSNELDTEAVIKYAEQLGAEKSAEKAAALTSEQNDKARDQQRAISKAEKQAMARAVEKSKAKQGIATPKSIKKASAEKKKTTGAQKLLR